MIKTEKAKGKSIDSVPPSLHFTKIYFLQKNQTEKDAEKFYNYYKSRKWKTINGRSICNWKIVATNWINNSRLKWAQH